jgi:hypothetical protein
MADLVVVAASVAPGTARPPRKKSGLLGETCTAGQVVYRSAVDGRLYLCDADNTQLTARAKGILANGGTAGQTASYYVDGDVDLGVTTTAGESYFTSDTPGGIRPYGDLDSTDWIGFLGIGLGGHILRLSILNSEIQKP